MHKITVKSVFLYETNYSNIGETIKFCFSILGQPERTCFVIPKNSSVRLTMGQLEYCHFLFIWA